MPAVPFLGLKHFSHPHRRPCALSAVTPLAFPGPWKPRLLSVDLPDPDTLCKWHRTMCGLL